MEKKAVVQYLGTAWPPPKFHVGGDERASG